MWVMLAAAVFSLGMVLQLTSVELSAQILATNIQYIGLVVLPIAWFIFSLQYTGHDKWLTNRNFLLLAIIPFVTVVLAWTNSYHSLMWEGMHLGNSGPFLIIVKTYGPWFWVHTSYSYMLIMLGVLVLVQRLFRPPRLYRVQSIALLISVIVPLGWNIVYVFNLTSLYRIDLTPSAFTVSGVAIAWGLYRLRLFDIIPIARETIIEGMKDGIIVVDTLNRLVDMNRIAERIIDYPASKAIGQSVDHVLSSQPKLVELLYGLTEETSDIVVGIGGMKRYYGVHISILQDHRYHHRGRLVVLHDLTEHKLIEAERKEFEDKAHLASRLSTVGKMAAGIAHEISNPLATVLGYADLLLKRNIPDEIKEDLEIINRGAKSAADILDRLLTFAGNLRIEWEIVDINRILEVAIEFRKHSLLNNNIETIKQFNRGLPETIADSGQIQEVFLNLIINAEDAMIESHGKGKLIIKTETTTDNNICVRFEDDGAGISEENISKIFDPFFTTKEVGKGIGLGLSICHGIITEHGGRIYAENNIGKGATFVIELPIMKMPSQTGKPNE